MENTNYVYRPHISYIRKAIPYIFGGIFVLYLFNAIRFYLLGYWIFPILLIGIILIIGLSIGGVMNWFFFKKFEQVQVQLTEDSIIYQNMTGKTVIPIESITKVDFPSVKYTGGWVTIKHADGKIRLTVVLENIGDFIVRLKTKLEEKDNQDTFDKNKMFSFYKTAVFTDQSWDRLYGVFSKLIGLTALNFIIGFIISSFAFNSYERPLFLAISFAMPGFVYMFADYFIATRVAKSADETSFTVAERDQAFESKIYKSAIGIYSVLYLIITALVVL